MITSLLKRGRGGVRYSCSHIVLPISIMTITMYSLPVSFFGGNLSIFAQTALPNCTYHPSAFTISVHKKKIPLLARLYNKTRIGTLMGGGGCTQKLGW
jgi:hypothetical protein